MDALASVPRSNVYCMELHKEGMAWRATSCAFAQEYSFAVCAWIIFVKNTHND